MSLAVQPAVNPLPGLTRHRVEHEGVATNVYEGGRGERGTVLLVHGFPNSAADWKHQVGPLVKAGYRVILPDLLGLGDSDMPDDVSLYTSARDAERVVAALDQLGADRIHIVCHDRGTGPGWLIPAQQPERVLSISSLTVGHLNAWGEAMPTVQLRERCWYMLFFQFESAVEALKADNFKLFREWMRFHPESDAWAKNLARPGALPAGINWYRANANPDRPQAGALPNVDTPTLVLYSPEDRYSSLKAVLNTHKFVDGPYRAQRVDGTTHFMMLDRPAEVTRLILGHIGEYRR